MDQRSNPLLRLGGTHSPRPPNCNNDKTMNFNSPLTRPLLRSRRPSLPVASLGILLLSVSLTAAQFPLEDPLKSTGWQHFYNNEYDEAYRFFRAQADQKPSDQLVYNHLAEVLLYRELFRNGALESELVTGNNPFLRRTRMNVTPEVQEEFRSAVSKSLAINRSRLKTNPKDMESLYALSVCYGLQANYEFLVEKAWTAALRDATSSRKFSDRVIELDPGFVDTYLVQGLHNYVVGSLPLYARWLGFLAGFHGDRQKGIQEVQRVAEHGVLNKYDARVLLAAIFRRERRPTDALPLLNDLAKTFPRNYLFRLEQVQMYSDLGNKAAALNVLEEVEALRASGSPGYGNLPEAKIQYLRGNLLFWYGDLNPALADMQQVTQEADELDLNTAVLAWLRLGQIYDLRGDRSRAITAYRTTVMTAPDSAVALEAQSYISTPYKPKPDGRVSAGSASSKPASQ
jgi:tetratricopeptide (TPR) repeat protein